MRLSNKVISLLQKILLASVAVILIVTFLQLVFIGKNLTFTTRFTPVVSEENILRNQTYITEAQVLIIILCILYVFALPYSLYSAINQSKKIFLPSLLIVIAINIGLVILNFYFLTGASNYRKYMGQQYDNLVENNSICKNNNINLCMIGTCTRLQVFQEAKDMSISFTVINSIFALIFTSLSILCNKRRKDAQKLQLIV